MLVLGDGHIYLEAGEHLPFVCPECEHIMEWAEGQDLIVCAKCDHQGAVEDFSNFEWKLSRVN